MVTVRLGRTNIVVNRNGFGALPMQRISVEESTKILKKAYENEINFYDTARAYSDSEYKIGQAFGEIFKTNRKNIFISTKTKETSAEAFWKDLNTSLKELKTDYIDIYQFHNPSFCPKPNDGTGAYEAMLEAKAQGKIHFIGITNHRLPVAIEAVNSGLYDTLQFPFNYLATSDEEKLVKLCKEKNVGFLCMKALSGGLITRADATYAHLASYDNTLPLWGIQKMSELDEFISFNDDPPQMNEEIAALIKKDIKELSGEFCRGCGYCMPTCPAKIQINQCARMSLLLRRSPTKNLLDEQGQAMMKKIDECIECGQCKKHCPYGLDTPNLLKRNYADYKTFLK